MLKLPDMSIRFAHASITARDLAKLAEFYGNVFDCAPALPEKSFSGEWLEKGTGVPGAAFKRVHLKFPGDDGEEPPILEIIEYEVSSDGSPHAPANSKGLRHIAFETETVDELKRRRELVLAHGGSKLGEITSRRIEGVGEVTFVYLTDPEGNIVELVNWQEPDPMPPVEE